MATATRFSTESRNAAVAAITALIGAGGKLKIYDGAQPVNPNTALTTQVKLAELALSATPFGAPVNGTATANSITQDASADATGTASWFSITKSDDTRIWEGSVGTADANLILATVNIVAGGIVSVTSLTITALLEAD